MNGKKYNGWLKDYQPEAKDFVATFDRIDEFAEWGLGVDLDEVDELIIAGEILTEMIQEDFDEVEEQIDKVSKDDGNHEQLFNQLMNISEILDEAKGMVERLKEIRKGV